MKKKTIKYEKSMWKKTAGCNKKILLGEQKLAGATEKDTQTIQ
jgi:hypothetical protein